MEIQGKLILAFVTLLLGVILVGTIATEGLLRTDKLNIDDEAVDITSLRIDNNNINESLTVAVTNAPTSWKSEDCPLTNVVYGNASEDFTVTTDYTIDAATGSLTVKNTSTTVNSVPNATYIDYNYCNDDYLNLGWGRTLINLVAGFFAIAILLVSVGLFYSVAKDANII